MFRFKRFSVCQQGCAMKVGTDGVLLGAWCALEASQRRVLDIGTGTGVIALMAAQRSAEARITAVDIDGECARRAAGNFAASPWGDRLEAVQADIRDFASGHTFDHIITNPPYFSSSLLPPDSGRRLARHCVALPFADLAAARTVRPRVDDTARRCGRCVRRDMPRHAEPVAPLRRQNHSQLCRKALDAGIRARRLRGATSRAAGHTDRPRDLYRGVPHADARFLPEILIWYEKVLFLL